MTNFIRIGLRATFASLLLVGGLWNTAQAQLTPAGDSVVNRATVNYSVGLVPQTEIESSPDGNDIPGAGLGEDTTFLVDQLVDLTVSELSGAETLTVPGGTAVTEFTVTNEGNEGQGYQLTVTEEVGTTLFSNPADNYTIGIANLSIFVDEGPLGGGGNGTFEGTEPQISFIDALGPGESIRVFVVADIPIDAPNASYANVNLLAQTAVAGTSGATLQAEDDPGLPGNDPDEIEVIFGDEDAAPGVFYDGAADASDQYAIQTAELTVEKDAAIISDPFGSADPLAVPGAIVEYTITITNDSTSPAPNGNATGVVINDPLPANTTFQVGVGDYGGDDVLITGGTLASCVAEAPPAAPDGDSCLRNALGELIVGAAAIGDIAPSGGTVTIQFRALID